MPRTNLRKAREAADLTQEELATGIGAEKKVVSAWEVGTQHPQPGHRRAVRDILHNNDPDLFKKFECDPEEAKEELASLQPPHVAVVGEAVESIDPHENERPAFLQPCHEKAKCDSLTFAPPSSLQSFFVTSPINHLLYIAHTDYSTPNEMTHAIQIAIQDFDTMNLDPVTRREALMTLAALPMTTLGQKQPLRVRHYEETLRQCAAALEGCWELYRGSDASGTQHAFECCCTYVPLLASIAHDSDRYCKAALDLAAQYAILQTLLGWSCVGARESVIYAIKARDLSRETGNILLQLSAIPKLAWTYTQSNNYIEALKVMQEGAYVLKCYQRKKSHAPLHSGVIGNFNSSYALVQADNGLSPDTALGIAVDSKPAQMPIALVKFTSIDQRWEAARICVAKGDPDQAMMWISKLINTETLMPRDDDLQVSLRGLVGTINTLTHALLQSKERDMERVIKTWTTAVEGAKVLRSEQRYRDALANFEVMKVLYPGEQAIMKLAPLTKHWSKRPERT